MVEDTRGTTIRGVQDALNTEEYGANLVEVARAAHKAEYILSHAIRVAHKMEQTDQVRQLLLIMEGPK